jgi:hypothetical protein
LPYVRPLKVALCHPAGSAARVLRFALPRLLDVLSPLYNPRKKRAPRGAAELLNEIRPAA